jgi:ribosome-binding protein aMBF1 (putative translation factor)
MEKIKPLHEQIAFAVNCSSYTVHTFAQQMNMKLRTLEAIMNGSETPEKKIISKMNKFLNKKIIQSK